MSRIHEALKRAAEERAAQLAAGSEANVADLASELALLKRGPELTRPAVSARDTTSGSENTFLRFEELGKRCVKLEWHIDPQDNVFINSRPGEEGPERFHALRSRLYKIASARKLKRVLLTSGVAGEGKTFVTFNLAQSIARQPEIRVLLIDADLRSPQLLNRVTPLFDWIILDSPPSLHVDDAGILANLADGVLFVIRAGSTDAQMAKRAAAEFQGKNLLGVVLNEVEKGDSDRDEQQNDCYGQRNDAAETTTPTSVARH